MLYPLFGLLFSFLNASLSETVSEYTEETADSISNDGTPPPETHQKFLFPAVPFQLKRSAGKDSFSRVEVETDDSSYVDITCRGTLNFHAKFGFSIFDRYQVSLKSLNIDNETVWKFNPENATDNVQLNLNYHDFGSPQQICNKIFSALKRKNLLR
jgi:hypothetical protein